jgi:hypothetical protein
MANATLTEIRAAAQCLADAHRESISRATALETEISKAITPIYARHRIGIDAAAEEEAAAKAELLDMVMAAPNLFQRPRSLTVDGVKAGYRKEEDGLTWEDDSQVIARIRALPELQELAPLLIRIEESLNAAALAELDAKQRRQIGISLVQGVDKPFVSFTDSDVEKMVKGILADAAKRQGDEEPATKKKAKVKTKEVV